MGAEGSFQVGNQKINFDSGRNLVFHSLTVLIETNIVSKRKFN